MLKFLNKKKKDNKGFSLVELIIVVAILAILVGLLAPQYIKYVEKSRKSADASNLSEMVNAVQIYAADAESSLPAGTYTITISKDKTEITSSKNEGLNNVKKAVAETAPDYEHTKLKSSKWKDDEENTSIVATIVVDNNGGTKVTYTPEKLESFILNKTTTTPSGN
ncbi:type IV pilin protein [Anaerobutyricum hallii]|nr:prepilin-type N-terminal cleavage/methylation domain-containing protein [Anaerobutyricum hallii]